MVTVGPSPTSLHWDQQLLPLAPTLSALGRVNRRWESTHVQRGCKDLLEKVFGGLEWFRESSHIPSHTFVSAPDPSHVTAPSRGDRDVRRWEDPPRRRHTSERPSSRPGSASSSSARFGAGLRASSPPGASCDGEGLVEEVPKQTQPEQQSRWKRQPCNYATTANVSTVSDVVFSPRSGQRIKRVLSFSECSGLVQVYSNSKHADADAACSLNRLVLLTKDHQTAMMFVVYFFPVHLLAQLKHTTAGVG